MCDICVSTPLVLIQHPLRHIACEGNHLRCINLLIERGANLNAKNKVNKLFIMRLKAIPNNSRALDLDSESETFLATSLNRSCRHVVASLVELEHSKHIPLDCSIL